MDWQVSYLVMFVYISVTLGDYTPSVSPFYVTSKVHFSSPNISAVVVRLPLKPETQLGKLGRGNSYLFNIRC